jgi:hypothetical protein
MINYRLHTGKTDPSDYLSVLMCHESWKNLDAIMAFRVNLTSNF